MLRQRKRYAHWIVLAIAALLVTSCSVRMSYPFLDNLMGWELGRYVSLNSEQKRMASDTFDEFHEWHRYTQLPRYADYLESLKKGMLDKPVSPEYLHAESDVLQDMLDDAMAHLLPGLTEIAATLDDDQIHEIRKKLQKDREEYREDYLDDKPEKIQKRRIREITRLIGGFFGRFSDEQTTRMETWESSLQAHAPLMLGQQEIWEQDFVKAMAYRDDKAELQKRLKALMLYRTDNWDPELQERLDYNQEQTFIMLADLFNSQSPEQEKKMIKKFDQYIRDFRALSKRD